MQATTFPRDLKSLVWNSLKQHPYILFVFAVTSLIWSAEMSLSPYLLKLIIDGVNNTSRHPQLLIGAILVPTLLYVFLSVFLNLTFRVYGLACMNLFPALKAKVAKDAFEYLSQHSYRYFQEHFSGVLTKKILDISEGIDPLIQIPNEMFIPRVLATLFATLTLALVQPYLSIFLLFWILAFTAVTFYFSKHTESYALMTAQAYSTMNGHLTDSVSNIITSKLFARESFESNRLRGSLQSLVDNDRSLQHTIMVSHFVQGLLVTVLIAGMMAGLIYERLHGTVTVGDFAFVISLAIMITMQIWDIGQQMVLFMKTVGTCRQALDIITAPIEIPDAPNAKALKITEGQIEFDHVNFGYTSKSMTLKDIHVTIKPGENVGLVGFSGGGKSTFVKLITRLFEVNSGDIKIDGQSIKDVTKESLRSQVAMIPQEAELFNRSIFDNIRYGNLNSTFEEVVDAAKRAHCHEFIMQLPHQYNTQVGEKGVKLSGGQRQRIAIARAILKKAPILILDEATSALDSQTERYIQDSFHDMMIGSTTLVIAHRLSTLMEMDRILFFKDGHIVEDGTLEELKLRNSYFTELWKMQSDGYIPELEGELDDND